MGYLHIAAATPLRPYLFYLSSAVLFFGSFFASRTMLYTYSVIHCSEYPRRSLYWRTVMAVPNGFGADLMHCFFSHTA